MNEFKYKYRCSDIARVFIGSINLTDDTTDVNASVKAYNFIHNIYKGKKCNLSLVDKRISDNESDNISYNEQLIINTAILYK